MIPFAVGIKFVVASVAAHKEIIKVLWRIQRKLINWGNTMSLNLQCFAQKSEYKAS